MLVTIFILVLVGFVSWGATFTLYRYATARGVMDVPNERSSHNKPTPRGGGLAIAVVFLISIALVYILGLSDGPLIRALLVGGTPIAVVGFIDDRYGVRAAFRLLVHFGATGWVLYVLGGLPPVDFGIAVVNLGIVGTIATFFYVVWFINLYNFMDGIDGIAGVEAICITGSAAVLIFLHGGRAEFIAPPLLLAAAVAGF